MYHERIKIFPDQDSAHQEFEETLDLVTEQILLSSCTLEVVLQISNGTLETMTHECRFRGLATSLGFEAQE